MNAGTVYLIHMDSKIHHAQHYIGYTRHFKRRIAHHKKGTGARLLAAAVRRGINFDVARTWKNSDGNFERKLKNRKKARLLCPTCRQKEEIR